MNPLEQLVSTFQDLVAEVPEVLQPVIVLIAGAIPFVEGEGGTAVGIIGGLNPIAAAFAAAAGNFLCVVVIVMLSSRARAATMNRRAVRVRATLARVGADVGGSPAARGSFDSEDEPAPPESKGRQKFKTWIVRFGVPGASIIGPLAIPTQITSAILIASGTRRGWVLLWQAVAIVIWTTVTTISVSLALRVATGL